MRFQPFAWLGFFFILLFAFVLFSYSLAYLDSDYITLSFGCFVWLVGCVSLLFVCMFVYFVSFGYFSYCFVMELTFFPSLHFRVLKGPGVAGIKKVADHNAALSLILNAEMGKRSICSLWIVFIVEYLYLLLLLICLFVGIFVLFSCCLVFFIVSAALWEHLYHIDVLCWFSSHRCCPLKGFRDGA